MNHKRISLRTAIWTVALNLALLAPHVVAQQAQSPDPVPAQPAPQVAAAASNSNQAQAAAAAVPEEKKDEDETVFDNGVKMKILRAGKGPKPAPNAIVQIQYIGSLEDGTEFDRSYSRRYPSVYKLSDVIGCWQTAIPEMQVGSKAKFTCPPGSANGKRPVDFIWGDTTLYFVVELIAITG